MDEDCPLISADQPFGQTDGPLSAHSEASSLAASFNLEGGKADGSVCTGHWQEGSLHISNKIQFVLTKGYVRGLAHSWCGMAASNREGALLKIDDRMWENRVQATSRVRFRRWGVGGKEGTDGMRLFGPVFWGSGCNFVSL